MKIGSKDHIKVKRLMRRLNIRQYQAVGVLEMLLQVAALSADDGGVGRYSDNDLAIELDWDGDPTELVAALVDSGWLDKCETNRLVVHDWLDHAPDFIKERIRKRGQRTYVRKKQDTPEDVPPVSGSDQTSGGQSDYYITTNSIPTNSNPLKPNHRSARDRTGALTSLAVEDLHDTAKVLAWCTGKLKLEMSEERTLFALAASEAALTGANPPGLFVSIVTADDRSSVTAAQLERASKRLQEWKTRGSPRGQPAA